MSSTPTPASNNTSTFDRLSFLKYVKNIGRPYRKRAAELISISRTFAHAEEQGQSFWSYDDLKSVLQVVDDALRSAIKAQKKTLKDVDESFKKATDALSAYERTHHPNAKTLIAERMKTAEEKDTSSLKFLNRLKENWQPLVKEPTMTVEFILHKSLLDKSPTIVRQELSPSSDVKEILWNFSRRPTGKDSDEKKRLSLRQHPHFYRKLPQRYGGGFRTYPTETFSYEQISVLTDNSGPAGRVYLEIPKRKRVFSNVWDARGTIIFQDILGKLEGENIVGSDIQNTPNLWCFEEPPRSRSHASQQSLSTTSTILNSSPSTMPPTPTTSPTGELEKDWKEPIRRMTRYSLDINVRISPILPANSSQTYPLAPVAALSFPAPSFVSNPTVSNPPIDIPQPRLPIKIQIPETPTRSSTPLSYKTAQSASPALPSPEMPPASPSPVPMPMPPSPPPRPPPSFPLPMPPPPPPPPSFTLPISLPPPGPAMPTPTRYLLPGTSSRVEFQEGAVSGGQLSSQPAFIAGVPPVTTYTNATIISPQHNVSTLRPHTESFKAGVSVGDLLSQSTDPDPEDEDLSDDDASTVTPTSQIRNLKRKKRKWYQRIFDRLLRPQSSQRTNASMLNPPGYGVSK